MGKEEGWRMEGTVAYVEIHPAFVKLIEICKQIRFGTIKELKIADGLPVYITNNMETELDAIIEVSKKLV